MGIRDIMRAVLFTPGETGWGLALAFVGGPGVGKTFTGREVTQQCGLLCEVVSPGERGEGGVGCVPMPRTLNAQEKEWMGLQPDSTEAALNYPLPEWALPFFKEGRGVVYVDELTTAPPALQPALLSLVLDRRIGGRALPRGVRVIAAYNPAESAANGYALPKPVANRMGHIEWDSDALGASSGHADWMIATIGETEALQDVGSQGDITKAELDPVAEEARVLRLWPAAAARAGASYATFIKKRPALLCVEPEPHEPKASGPWPSPRTWAMAVRAVAAAAVHNLGDDDRNKLICAFVGDGAGGEFIDHLDAEELPDAEAVLDGQIEFKHDPTREDITLAVLDACCAFCVPKNADKRDARAKRFWKLLTGIIDGSAVLSKRGTQSAVGAKDLAFPSASRLAKAGHLRHAEARPVLKALNPMMAAAGIKVQS